MHTRHNRKTHNHFTIRSNHITLTHHYLKLFALMDILYVLPYQNTPFYFAPTLHLQPPTFIAYLDKSYATSQTLTILITRDTHKSNLCFETYSETNTHFQPSTHSRNVRSSLLLILSSSILFVVPFYNIISHSSTADHPTPPHLAPLFSVVYLCFALPFAISLSSSPPMRCVLCCYDGPNEART